MTAPITVKVRNAAGTAYVATGLDDVLSVQWLDQFNDTGAGSVRVPLSGASAALLTRDRIVECWYSGACRFAFPVEAASVTVAGDGATPVREVSGRGLMSVLGDAVLLPTSGGAMSGTVRAFNFTSPDVASHDLGVTWGTPATLAGTKPDNWPAPTAVWMTVPSAGTDGAWVRSSLFTPTSTRLRFAVAATDAFAVWLDGVEVMSMAARTGAKAFRSVDMVVPAGSHRVGLVSPSPLCLFLFAALSVDETTGKLGAAEKVSSASWVGTRATPAWAAGDVLATAVGDAVARGVDRADLLSLGFSASTDSNGDPWTVDVWRPSWPAGTTVLDLATDLCGFGADVWVDHATRTLHAANGRGSDVSGSVALTLGENVVAYSVAEPYRVASRLLIPRDQGRTWTMVNDAARAAVVGLREAVAQAADTVRESDLTTYADITLDAIDPGPSVSEAKCVPVAGATPYVDFGVGDTISAPDASGAAVPARVLSLSLSLDGEAVVFTPELELVPGRRRHALRDDWASVSDALQSVTGPGSAPGEGPGDLAEDPASTFTDPGPVGNGQWPPVPPVTVSDVEPTDPDGGGIWVDPTTGTIQVWQDDPGPGEWVQVGGGGTGTPEVHIGPDAPTGGEVLWVDTS